MTKHRSLSRSLLAAAGAALLLSAAQAGEGPVTREQVRAELAEARAAGLLDQPGEAGATEAVLVAREAWNALQAAVLQARLALETQLLSAAMAVDGEPDLDIYYEMGPDGPQMVLLTYDGDGTLHSADTLLLASMD